MRNRYIARFLLIQCVVAILVADFMSSAQAEDQVVALPQPQPQYRSWAATIYGATLVDAGLWTAAERAVSGRNLNIGAANFVGIGLTKTLFTNSTGFRIEIETQLVKHFDADNYLESATAAMLRTPAIPIGPNFSANFAIGDGISYAFTPPEYEWGPTARGVDTRRLLNYVAFETEFSAVTVPDFHLVLMLHHRCAAGGLYGPTSLGSSYFGAGLRADLR